MSLSSKSGESSNPYRFGGTHGRSPVNQSPDGAFEVPLFPGYVKHRSRPKYAYINDRLTASSTRPSPHGSSQRKAAAQVSAQHASAELHKLRSQLHSQEQRHELELRQLETQLEAKLEAKWQERLDAAITLQSSTAHLANTDSYGGVVDQTLPASLSPFGKVKPSLRHVPTTHQPMVFRVTVFDKLLGAIPSFLVWVVAGIALAGVSAIALSPTLLWPSMSSIIQAMIPYIFVVGLSSLFVTAVWSVSR
ncbi:MAG: hypothetical protein AAFU53_16395 [Cyanobacteria bacterium J06632_3]